MEQFIVKHQDKITGMISCFDRLPFKGYLPICHPETMESFLRRNDVLLKQFKTFASRCSQSLKLAAEEKARRAGRPFQYLSSPIRKEEKAREIAQRDGGLPRAWYASFPLWKPARASSSSTPRAVHA